METVPTVNILVGHLGWATITAIRLVQPPPTNHHMITGYMTSNGTVLPKVVVPVTSTTITNKVVVTTIRDIKDRSPLLRACTQATSLEALTPVHPTSQEACHQEVVINGLETTGNHRGVEASVGPLYPLQAVLPSLHPPHRPHPSTSSNACLHNVPQMPVVRANLHLSHRPNRRSLAVTPQRRR